MAGKPMEKADPNSWEFTDYRPTAGEPAWSQTRSPTRVTVCVSWTVCGTPEVGPRSIPSAFFFFEPFHMVLCLAQPQCRREGFGPVSTECARPC